MPPRRRGEGSALVGTIILCVIALLMAVLLFTPIRLRASYEAGAARAWLLLGPKSVTLWPQAEKTAKKQKETPSETEGEVKKEKKSKKKPRVNLEQILYSLEKLPPILGRALRRVGRRIHFDPLKIHVLVAGKDPADTAVLYGKLQAALAAGLPTLHRLVHIYNQDIRLFLDFQEEKMDCIADVGVSIRLWDILVIGLCAGASAVKWFIGFRKLADKSAGDDTAPTTKDDPAGKAGAA